MEVSPTASQKRILPLDKECLADKAVDYKLYSILQKISHYNGKGVRFVYKNHPTLGNLTRPRLLEIYNEKCADPQERISLSTLKRKMTLFKSIGMISEGKIKDINGKEVNAFILLENFALFQYIPLETLEYLADTASSTVIKLYAFLLNKFLWKAKFNDTYVFTYAELAAEIGLNDNNNGNTRIIRNCLNSLSNSELIEYCDFYVMTDSGVPSPRKKLINVNQYYKKKV